MFAGGGILEDQVIGGRPITKSFHPNDIGATTYTALGFGPQATIPDALGQPRPLNQGKVMDARYRGIV